MSFAVRTRPASTQSRTSPAQLSDYRTVQRYADQARTSFKRSLLEFWDDKRRALDEIELARRLEEKGLNAQIIDWALMREDLWALYQQLGDVAKSTAVALVPSTVRQARQAETFADPVINRLEFELRLKQAETYLSSQEYSYLLQTLISPEAVSIQELLVKSFAEGVPPLQIAREIRQTLGLSAEYRRAVERYRASLQTTPERAERLVGQYQRHLEVYRAETIARTETIRAANVGQSVLWNQAASDGVLPAYRTRRLWIQTPDDRTCDFCRSLKDQTTMLDGQWRTRFGAVSTPPLHPRCRCAQGLVFE